MRQPSGILSTVAQVSSPSPAYKDESVPAHPNMDRGYPLVVFGDHRFCAGSTLKVQPMRGPHMHSQVELNFVLSGSMTYWFDGRVLTLSAGRLALFWGMIPHQVTECDPGTSFVVLYVPMAVFLELPTLSALRAAIFRGAVIEALDIKSYDRDMFLRWREDLLAGDAPLEQIVKDELSARIRRLDREGWHDLREVSPVVPQGAHLGHDHDRAVRVEKMAQFIGEHALGGYFGGRCGPGGGASPQLCDDALQARHRPHHQAVHHAAPARYRAIHADRLRPAGGGDRLRLRLRLAVELLRRLRAALPHQPGSLPADLQPHHQSGLTLESRKDFAGAAH